MSIGNINAIPWYLRLGIFMVLALVVYGGFWYFVTSGTRKETKGLQEQISVLQKANAEAQIASQRLQDRARMTGLSLRKFLPKDDVQQDFYSGKRIDVSVQSSFAGLRAFFDQMAHYQRIVSITNFELKQMDKQAASKTVEARFDLTAYYVSSRVRSFRSKTPMERRQRKTMLPRKRPSKPRRSVTKLID
jgi:Tfp pilus assembly protein PilO